MFVRYLLAALALVPGLLAGCADQPEPRQSGATPAVEALPARAGALPLEQRLSGSVRAANQVEVRPQIAAPIAEVLVRTGEAVRRGQPLVRLRDDALREQQRQAQAQLELARAAAAGSRARAGEVEARVARVRALAAQGLVSEMEADAATAELASAAAAEAEAAARVAQAAATLEERRADFDRSLVRAPADGVVGQQGARVGMMADPGDTLFVLGDLERLVVEVPLSEGMLAFVRPGQPVEISATTLRRPLRATLSRVSPFLGPGSFATVGEIDLGAEQLAAAEGRLLPGMFVTVDVLYGAGEEATLVPTSALWEDPQSGRRGVYVADGIAAPAEGEAARLATQPSPVEFRPVEVVGEGRDAVGVRGVSPGEWVVTVGQHLLAEADEPSTGARVRPTSWEKVADLQRLQREQVLDEFLAKQQRLARSLGAEPPPADEPPPAAPVPPGRQGG